MNEVLKLFEGLTEKQVRELRKAIMPTLWELRKVILDAESKQKTAHEQGQNKQRLCDGTVQSKNKQRANL